MTAAHEVATGGHRGEFPIDVVHGGGGTAVNMNVNEVIANRANELLGGARGSYDRVHPNDHVNRSQSTNDVYPTALALATHMLGGELLERVEVLEAALTAKAAEVGEAMHLGRTCLQDAVPLRIADTHLSQAHALGRTADALASALSELLEVPLGATAVGTGIGASDAYRDSVIELLAEETGLARATLGEPLRRARPQRRVPERRGPAAARLDRGREDRLGHPAARLTPVRRAAAAGGAGGLVDHARQDQPGHARARPAVAHAGAGRASPWSAAAVSAGELELNVMEPVIARHLLGGMRELGAAIELFAERCVVGLEWDLDAVATHLAGSRADAVLRAADEGYDAIR